MKKLQEDHGGIFWTTITISFVLLVHNGREPVFLIALAILPILIVLFLRKPNLLPIAIYLLIFGALGRYTRYFRQTYASDTLLAIKDHIGYFLAGKNVYEQIVMAQSGPTPFTYLPFSLFWYLPARLLSIDLRWFEMLVSALVAPLVLMYGRILKTWKHLPVVAVVALTPFLLDLSADGSNDNSAIFLLLAALALFLAHLHRKYFQASSGKTPSSLSEWVESRSKEICKPERESILELLRENIYLPSPLSLALISGIVMIGVLISRYFFEHLNFFAVEEQRNFVLTIHAGVGAIIFALVIFVAESLRDKDEKDTARVLLRESLLFPLTVAEIEVFIYFLLFKENTVIPVIGVSLLAIYSLYQLIAVLISRYRFGQKRIQLLKDRIKQNIQQARRERGGNKLLIKDWLET